MQLKAISHSISFNIQDQGRIPWPPTPNDKLESNEFLDLDNAPMCKDGFVGLSYRKATKINEIVQNI